jgi:hypothetical protein
VFDFYLIRVEQVGDRFLPGGNVGVVDCSLPRIPRFIVGIEARVLAAARTDQYLVARFGPEAEIFVARFGALCRNRRRGGPTLA